MIAKLLMLHFLADSILQPRKMGRMKSKHIGWLSAHLLIQFLVFLPFAGLKFAGYNALIHGVIDGSIWNIYGFICVWRFPWLKNPDMVKTFKYQDDDLFYKTIMFDQMLHGLTLVYLAGRFL